MTKQISPRSSRFRPHAFLSNSQLRSRSVGGSVPSAVASVFAAAGLVPDGVVRWEETVPPPVGHAANTGVYAIALAKDTSSVLGTLDTCPIDRAALKRLLDARPELTVDRRRPNVRELGARLGGFWLADEVVVYIGRAGPRRRIDISPLSDRVAEYYNTPLGARAPTQAGGR